MTTPPPMPPSDAAETDGLLERAPYRLVVFWKEDARTKKTFLQYKEVQVEKKKPGSKKEEEDGEGEWVFYPLLMAEKLEELLLEWKDIITMEDALASRSAALDEAQVIFDQALEASDNPHCETFVAQTALNYLTTLELIFNIVFFADELPLFFDQATVAKTQQTGSLYLWLDPYLAGISLRQHKPIDTEEAEWPVKEELYCYFKRKSDPTVSPQQIANLWRTTASRVVELDEECRQKLWEWLKGQKFSADEIRALILP